MSLWATDHDEYRGWVEGRAHLRSQRQWIGGEILQPRSLPPQNAMPLAEWLSDCEASEPNTSSCSQRHGRPI
jgi:hypothetical protein